MRWTPFLEFIGQAVAKCRMKLGAGIVESISTGGRQFRIGTEFREAIGKVLGSIPLVLTGVLP